MVKHVYYLIFDTLQHILSIELNRLIFPAQLSVKGSTLDWTAQEISGNEQQASVGVWPSNPDPKFGIGTADSGMLSAGVIHWIR